MRRSKWSLGFAAVGLGGVVVAAGLAAAKGSARYPEGPAWGAETRLLGGYAISGAGRANAGDRDGKGWATVVGVGRSTLCYSVILTNIRPATAAHVHRGPPGNNGPIVATLGVSANQPSSGCVPVNPTLLSAMKANRSGYYVNVHTADFPDGAIRGQLP